MTPADDASNTIDFLHDEDYDRPFNPRNLDHQTMVIMAGRETHSLDGDWTFVIDPFDTGLRQHWYRDPAPDKDGHTFPPDYQPDHGAPMPVPSCWNVFDRDLFHYEGGTWYTRNFAAPDHDGPTLLRIGASNYDTKVFLNGSFIGNHYGGSTPFFADLTAGLRDHNRLQIYVNNQRTRDRVPMSHFDWFNYGGIHRDIELVCLPAAHIKDLFVHLVPGTDRTIRVRAEVTGAADGDTIQIDMPELSVSTGLVISGGIAEGQLSATPDLWSPQSPTLYTVHARFGADEITDRIGFRHITVRGHQIQLNGEPIFLRGICLHEDNVDLGRVTTEAGIRHCFETARDLGCNMLRLAHYPHHEAAARIADEVGLLLWEEVPVYWAIAFDNPATLDDATNQLSELIKRDRNRASVIMWSVGNENADTDARLGFMSSLARTARTLDPTRLVTAACLINKQTCRIEDRLTDHLDVVGINEYYGWYESGYGGLERLIDAYDGSKPVFISEVGADAVAGNHGQETERFTEQHQASVYREQLARLRDFTALCGLSPWLLFDFRSNRRQNAYQRGYNRKGLVAADKLTRKAAFSVLHQFYTERRNPS